MKPTEDLSRLAGLAYGAVSGVTIGFLAGLVLLFTSTLVNSMNDMWLVVGGLVLICATLGYLLPRTFKIVSIILSLLPM
jgi:hypothetical protein